MVDTEPADLVIRLAPQGDPDAERAIRRLADLDSARPPSGPVLLAERGARAIAALSLRDGTAVADPFEPTADALTLLAVRAEQLGRARRRTGRLARMAERTRAAMSRRPRVAIR